MSGAPLTAVFPINHPVAAPLPGSSTEIGPGTPTGPGSLKAVLATRARMVWGLTGDY
jgi:hypothetical protein